METVYSLFDPTAVVIFSVSVIAASSILDALVPMPAEGSALFWVKKIIGVLAVNVRNARNAV